MRASIRDRFRIVSVGDLGARPVAAKLLDRPDLIEDLCEWIGDDPAHIEPWNVTEPEIQVALRMGLPINGTPPQLWPLGFKSAGRSLFREVGVPVAAGFEDLTSVVDAVDAIDGLRKANPDLSAVILKHDDSGAGDGNAVIRLDDLESAGSVLARRRLRSRINSLEPWYVEELRLGFVVEERIVGDRFIWVERLRGHVCGEGGGLAALVHRLHHADAAIADLAALRGWKVPPGGKDHGDGQERGEAGEPCNHIGFHCAAPPMVGSVTPG